jgi:hypothetical protein
MMLTSPLPQSQTFIANAKQAPQGALLKVQAAQLGQLLLLATSCAIRALTLIGDP